MWSKNCSSCSSVAILCGLIMVVTGSQIWYGTPEAIGYVGSCKQTCCCRVCGSPTNDAFPYGLTNAPITNNPPFPSVRGSSCHFSIWSDREYNDSYGNPVTVPDTLFWTNYSVFLDYTNHIAPISCDCCQFSGVDTSCKEIIPAATYPKYFYVEYGKVQEYQTTSLIFMDGVQLNRTDYVELRNDTFCGYLSPRPVLRQTDLTVFNNTFNSMINIGSLPSRGCYKVCYFASTLSTPQWYDLGYLTVHPRPQPATTVSYLFGPKDVLLAGNTATLSFFGTNWMSVFDDGAELRSSGSCGSGGAVMSTFTGTSGILDVVPGAEWCKPAVKPKITAVRPLNYIAIKYTDCVLKNRVYQSRVQWGLTFPTSSVDVNYTICYRLNSTWKTVGTALVHGQQTARNALMLLYAATNGASWKHQSNWGNTNPCTFFGVRCDINNQVTALYLSRNNISGTIPSNMFYAPFFATLTHLAIDMNALSGTVPREIGALRKLSFLDIGFNNLTGTLPATLDDTSLYIAYMGNNDLSGAIPQSLDSVGLTWTSFGNTLEDPLDELQAPGCPKDIMECSQRGSRDYGTTQCGTDGITEAACKAYGCCFNPQAPLVFGGTACFTRRRVSFAKYPPCAKLTCMPVTSS